MTSSTSTTETAPQLCCSSPGCTNIVETLLACPKCIQLGLPPTYFCGQVCYKNNYTIHKKVHIIPKAATTTIATTPTTAATTTSTEGAVVVQKHRKTPPSNGIYCSDDTDIDIKLSLPDWAKSYHFTGTLRPTLLSPQRTVPSHIRKPDYADHPSGISECEQHDRSTNNNIRIYTKNELEGTDCNGYGIRHANLMGREILDIAGNALKIGVSADEIDRIVFNACIERNCYPSPLNYYNFPKSLCISVNEVICHGIPDYRIFHNGDIVNLDISIYNQGGYHSDLNETYMIGDVDIDGIRVIQTSFECLAAALQIVKPGTLYRDIGTVIEKLAKHNKCSVVRTYCGHGIGTLFHTTPNIPHYNKNKAKGIMKSGHIFTIEPMINLGKSYDKTWDDNWTSVTTDGSRSAQFEHTILVTDTGYELLTARHNEPITKWNPTLNQR